MGAIASKDLTQSPEIYAEKARKTQELPNRILHLLFSQTDFKDILALSSVDACPTYVFTTAAALQTLFQKLEIQPSKGKSGEILFAPIAKLSPGLITQKNGTSSFEQAERQKQRNRVCMDVAFFYVRVFQIYAALALTTMNTNPTRRSSYFPQRGKPGAPAPAPLMYGGAVDERQRGFRGQRTDAKWKQFYFNNLYGSKFIVLENYFRFVKDVSTGLIFLKLDVPSASGSFTIKWEAEKDALEGTYIYTGTGTGKGTPLPPILVSIDMARDKQSAVLKFNNTGIIEFSPKANFGWIVDEGASEVERNRAIAQSINGYFEPYVEDIKQGKPVAGKPVPGKPGAIGGPGVGKSSFHSFDDMKKMFESFHKGIGDFPKAYCIARAMTLMNPIFNAERLDKFQPIRSHVCNKQLDFDPNKYLPYSGTYANANFYFRSLVALSYETFEFANEQVSMVQSTKSQELLQQASRRLATLYKIQVDDATKQTFLTARLAFKTPDLCKNGDATIILTENERKVMFTNVVLPMLQEQEKHNEKVKLLLQKLFEIQEGRLRFSRTIANGGLEAINEIAHEAFIILVDYYLKSDAYYFRGIRLLEGKDK
jgi:hypothetical protein